MLPEDMCDVVKLYLHFWNIYSGVHHLPGQTRRDQDTLQKYLFPENLRIVFLLYSLNVQIHFVIKKVNLYLLIYAIEIRVITTFQRSL